MMDQLPTLQKLIRQFQKVPYLASKNVYRVAGYFLTRDVKQVELFCQTLMQARQMIKQCVTCFNWTEGNASCALCLNTKRDKEIVCVVETWHDLCAIENAGGYDGVYHVLSGALCPLEGVGPDQLTIIQLVKRLEHGVKEVIFATNPTPEGEATASYIYSKINKYPVNISKLASGVPIGSSIEYMDRVTISRALLGRRPF